MAEEKKPVETKAEAPKTVPAEEFEKLYAQAVELETRYKRLLDAYNALLTLFVSHK